MLLGEPLESFMMIPKIKFHISLYKDDNERTIFLSIDISVHTDPPLSTISKVFLHDESRFILN